MLAARYEKPGPAHDVLRVEEIPTPEPGPGEVRVRVRMSGVNPTDWKARKGATGELPGGFQIPNQDGAGVVDAVGDGVDEGRVGERVWLFFAAFKRPWGTAAEYTVIPAEQAVPLPEGVSDELGASLGIPALTAHRCLLADGPIEGRTVLVQGGAGAVGHAAIELAVHLGARVIATVSGPEKAELARAAGAHEVVNYRDDDAIEQVRAAAPDRVHRVVEVALGENLPLDVAVCARNAAVSTYADDGAPPQLEVRRLMAANLVLRFVMVYVMGEEAVRAAVQGVTEALGAGALTPLPVHRFGLEQAADAHDAVEGGATGKVVIDVAA
jgi:NADPH2:quinone reductase